MLATKMGLWAAFTFFFCLCINPSLDTTPLRKPFLIPLAPTLLAVHSFLCSSVYPRAVLVVNPQVWVGTLHYWHFLKDELVCRGFLQGLAALPTCEANQGTGVCPWPPQHWYRVLFSAFFLSPFFLKFLSFCFSIAFILSFHNLTCLLLVGT